MLSTKLRFTQTQDPTGRPRALDGDPSVTAASYRNPATGLSATRTSVACPAVTATDSGWSFIGFDAMSKVDLHPHRWPPLSPS